MTSNLILDEGSTPHRTAIIGSPSNFWLHSSKTGFDLTHPKTPSGPKIDTRLTILTTTSPITVDPSKSALLIIDMQNFFLSPAFGRSQGPGHDALHQLVNFAIPAARKVGMRVVWLNWGLSEEDINEMPPAVKRAFGFEAVVDEGEVELGVPNDEISGERRKGVAVDKYGELTNQGKHYCLRMGRMGRFIGVWGVSVVK
jgi:hypothetical protein